MIEGHRLDANVRAVLEDISSAEHQRLRAVKTAPP
jgi:hypothetical protein